MSDTPLDIPISSPNVDKSQVNKKHVCTELLLQIELNETRIVRLPLRFGQNALEVFECSTLDIIWNFVTDR